jgi:hypothetical protein
MDAIYGKIITVMVNRLEMAWHELTEKFTVERLLMKPKDRKI